ncbi:hypothetical protein D770_04750 [Flammeovirgaceae bacterium 311]|nr:hypothetical protein D770_04750 [Flammeovirgaceae bacterium 311]
MKKLKEDMLNKSKLLKRGWTNTMINKFLPVADEQRRNSLYKNAAPMSLYLVERILEIESSQAFKDEIVRTERRKQAAKRATSTKERDLLAEVDKLNFDIPVLDKSLLIKLACDNYDGIHYYKGKHANPDADPEFLDRIIVNYLRHVESKYEEALGANKGKVGVDDARFHIRKKVYDAIGELYPWLKDQCATQLKTRYKL